MHVGVIGNIGVGKTTACTLLKSEFEKRGIAAKVLKENIDKDPYIDDFYRDPKKYAFIFQVNLLSVRYAQHKSARDTIASQTVVLQDRTIYDDIAFVNTLEDLGKMTPLDASTYRKLHKHMVDELEYPKIFIYLKAEVKVLQQRIIQRSRTCESGISDEYLSTLGNQYELLVDKLSKHTTVVVVDWNELKSPETLYSMISSALERN